MNAVTHFFEMGGYGLYVWGSYGVAFALIGLEIALLVRRSRRHVQREQQRRPVRPQWRETV
ncbi:MAG: heme exporter protein CcmD [Salinisphaera sp.]|nr:heme exporter protein CcmD [Salinisphaera sp.]